MDQRIDKKVRRNHKRFSFNKGVKTFLFGSRSQFNDLCHEIVTERQKKNPQIKRIIYTRRSEYKQQEKNVENT